MDNMDVIENGAITIISEDDPTQTKTFFLEKGGDIFLNIAIPSNRLEVLFHSMVHAFQKAPDYPDKYYMFRFSGSFKDFPF